MVAAYLSDKRVILKNNKSLTFDASIKVFALREQSPVRPPLYFGTEGSDATTLARNLDSPVSDLPSTLRLEEVKTRFEYAKMRYTERKKRNAEARSLTKWYRISSLVICMYHQVWCVIFNANIHEFISLIVCLLRIVFTDRKRPTI